MGPIALIPDAPSYVVDASVAGKWLLPDEPDTDAANRVMNDFRDGRTVLVAPTQIRFEVPSAVRNALRTGRLTPAEGRAAITDYRFPPLGTTD